VESAPPDTSTTLAAREHARAQGVRRAEYQPTVPARDAIGVVDRAGEAIAPERMLWDDVVGPGGESSRVLPRGAVVRFTDVDGDACANLLVYNAAQPLERLNVADTVKVQWQAYLGAGSLLLSDMGRVLLSIMADTSDTHDALCGASNRTRNEEKYGSGAVHGDHPNARDRFAVALAKHGLGRRAIVPNVNLFKGVTVDGEGRLHAREDEPRPGAYVELRAEMAVLVVVANTPHVLDPRPGYHVTPLRISAWSDRATTRDDPTWAATPEGERAYLQTEELLATTGARS
jgi:urea carboxylase-associated protein 2